mmetsp:Transcript_23466/g.28208  ORF Transcript_23466/g.28208 Transcript_23466/m.28208 type:complete len:139 (+) Transcript_23466:104-520(+)
MLRFLLILLFLIGCSASVILSSGENAETFISQSIQDNSVIVFSKSYCPYCRRTKSLLSDITKSTDIDVQIVELDLQQENDGQLIQSELLRLTGQRTVPNVFIHGKHIGGNSDLQQLADSGELSQILQAPEKDGAEPDL